MKVERGAKDRTSKTAGGKGRAAKALTVGSFRVHSTFKDRLVDTQRAQIKEELDALLERIDKQAGEIEKSLTFETIKEYRELVRQFVNLVVNDLFKLEDHSFVSPTGKRKPMILVKKIDEALDKFVQDFMTRQSNLLGFLNRMDEIKGMLLDLYS